MRRTLLLPLLLFGGCAATQQQQQSVPALTPKSDTTGVAAAPAPSPAINASAHEPAVVERGSATWSKPTSPAVARPVEIIVTPKVEPEPVTASQPVAPTPAPVDAVGELRRAADAKDATVAARKEIIALLIARGGSDDLVEAEKRLRALESEPGVSAQWLRLQRAALADAGGELADLEGAAREAWLAALRDLPLETRSIHLTDGERKDGAFGRRESISYRPDDYVSVAFEARYFGVANRKDERFDYAFKASARLLGEDGVAVADFAPSAHVYKGTLDYPAHRFGWFEFVLNQRLPRDIAAGNYTVELTLSDEMGKPGSVRVTLDIRVR